MLRGAVKKLTIRNPFVYWSRPESWEARKLIKNVNTLLTVLDPVLDLSKLLYKSWEHYAGR